MEHQLALPDTSTEPEWMRDLPQFVAATTFREAWDQHLAQLRAEGKDVDHLEAAYRDHLGPAFGALLIAQIETRHIVTWGRWAMRRGGRGSTPLARATVVKLVSFLSSALQRAVLHRAISINPARLPRDAFDDETPVDEVELARQVPTVVEIEALISDRRIPLVRRVLWGVLLLTGFRFGEAASLTWGDYLPASPLRELVAASSWSTKRRRLGATKTKTTKHVPVHPALEALLEEWRAAWTARFGRAPVATDILLASPARRPTPRRWREDTALKAWKRDLGELGALERKMHRTRDAFISRLTEAGAKPEIISRLTHPPKRTTAKSFERYRHVDWGPRCRAILCLQLRVLADSPQLDLFT